MRPAVLAFVLVTIWAAPVQPPSPPPLLPAAAVTQLAESLAAARAHSRSIWRDTPPFAAADRLSAVIEIGRGDRRKFEFDMARNTMALDRMMPEAVGGYPVNYGFVPQTVSYDGDPFDVLVLGPSLASGTQLTGLIVGLMHMEDEKGLDSKVVISPVGEGGRVLFELTAADRERIGAYFRTYKRHEPGKFSRVPGWGDAAQGLAYVRMTHTFFRQCAGRTGPCAVAAR